VGNSAITSPLQWTTDLPDGQISHFLSSPFRKNIPVPSIPKSLLYPPPSRPPEGRIAIVTDAGWDAVDAAASGALVKQRADEWRLIRLR
jgi:hypothetical protein